MKWWKAPNDRTRFSSEGFTQPLGPLERRVLENFAQLERTNVKGMVDALGDEFAYTTVMTTLDRLFKKGYLDREMLGRAYFYSMRVTQEEMLIGQLGDAITRLIDNATRSAEPVLASIVDSVGDRDRKLLDDLERLVREKRESIESK